MPYLTLEGYIIIGLICLISALIWHHLMLMDDHIRKDAALCEAQKYLTDEQWSAVVAAYSKALEE